MKDLTNKTIENGHILAVRYAWNSYVGVVADGVNKKALVLTKGANRFRGAAPYHDLTGNNIYQIVGHVDVTHKDYIEKTAKWFLSEKGNSPFVLRVYDFVLVEEFQNHINNKVYEGRKGYAHEVIKTNEGFVENTKKKISLEKLYLKSDKATHISVYFN